MNVKSLINEKYDGFSKLHKKIADYILQEEKRVIFYSCNELSKLIGVSDVTVLRFARELGYKNYQDFIDELRINIMDIVTKSERIELAENQIAKYEDRYWERDFSDAIRIINEASDIMNDDILAKSVDLLSNADQLVLVGFQSNSYLTSLAKSNLDSVGIESWIYSDYSNDSYKIFRESSDNRVAIYFALGEILDKDIRTLKALNEFGYKLILFCGQTEIGKTKINGVKLQYEKNHMAGMSMFMQIGAMIMLHTIFSKYMSINNLSFKDIANDIYSFYSTTSKKL